MRRGLSRPLLVGLTANLLFSSCVDDSAESEAPSQVELDTSQLSTRGQLTVQFDPPLITGSLFFLRLSGGILYWLSPAMGDIKAEFGVADPSSIEVTLEAFRRESVVLRLPVIPDDESAELCFNEDFAFCVPVDVSHYGEAAVPLPKGGEPGLTAALENQWNEHGQATETVDEQEPPETTREMQERMRLGGLFGSELRENFGSQLGVIGWSDDRAEFVVHGVGFTPDQISHVRVDAERLGVPVRVVETVLATSEQQQLSDLIREQVLHALPAEVGWSIGIDWDTQRISVAVEGYADLAALDRAIGRVVGGFVRVLEIQRAAINLPSLGQIDVGNLYYVVGS